MCICACKLRFHVQVFEAMEMNFRKLTQKYGGGGRGLALQAVRQYAKQLFIACKHMHGNGIVHADLKPDNIVVSKDYKTLKVKKEATCRAACS